MEHFLNILGGGVLLAAGLYMIYSKDVLCGILGTIFACFGLRLILPEVILWLS